MTPASFIASAGGVGYVPRAPGTAGALVGLVVGALLVILGHGLLVVGVVVAGVMGVWAVWVVGGQADPGWIVIDEVAGQMLAMVFLPRVTLLNLVVVFGLFRLFDIWKPGPVGWMDRRHDALGVMADDWVAGAMAAIGYLALVWAVGFVKCHVLRPCAL